MENMIRDETSILEKYGMVSCPRCNGLGKFFRNSKEFEVCMECGGFGAIRAPKEKLIHTTPKPPLSFGG
jgi:DnaJ-class molecular chaperone